MIEDIINSHLQNVILILFTGTAERFINADTLKGDISDSESLNGCAYANVLNKRGRS